LFFSSFSAFLAADRKDAVGIVDLDILLFETRQFGRDLDLLVGFGDVPCSA
jgi:predicted RNase H-like nuclease